jgi:hypothetical protein
MPWPLFAWVYESRLANFHQRLLPQNGRVFLSVADWPLLLPKHFPFRHVGKGASA